MDLLEIVLLCVCFLYAIVLHRVLTVMHANDKKVDVIYKETAEHLELLRQKHNSLVDAQHEIRQKYNSLIDAQHEMFGHILEQLKQAFLER